MPLGSNCVPSSRATRQTTIFFDSLFRPRDDMILALLIKLIRLLAEVMILDR